MERPVAVAAAAVGGEPERPDLPLSGSEWTRAPPRFNVVTKWEKGRSKLEGPAQKVEELEEKTYWVVRGGDKRGEGSLEPVQTRNCTRETQINESKYINKYLFVKKMVTFLVRSLGILTFVHIFIYLLILK